MGIEKAVKQLDSADIVLVVLDSSIGLSKEDEYILDKTKNYKTIYALNKTDLAICQNVIDAVKKIIDIDNNAHQKQIIEISALKHANIQKLKSMLFDMVVDKNILGNQILITNALSSLQNAKTSLENNLSLDLVALDIKQAWNSLGNITGETSSEEIVDRIFEKFCLGK